MKKITLLFAFLLAMTFTSYAQCSSIEGGNYPAGLINMVNDGSIQTIATDNYAAGEYSAISSLIIGNTYTVNGTNTNGIYITIAEIDWNAPAIGGTVLGNGANSVTFTATTTDIIIHWHLDAACGISGTENTLTTIQCTSATCSCTATSAPTAAATPSPVDTAVDVPITIDDTDPSAPVISVGPFSWTDNGEATVYDFNIVGVGTATGVSNPVTINYTWEYNTTYSWSVTSTNCIGTTTSAIYSFTTEEDPSLSIEDFVRNDTISHFYNTNSNDLTFKSSNLAFTNLEIYSILGQQVLNRKLSQTTETINLSNLTDGIYIAKVSIDGKTETIKFVKK
ncbi:T9SS type A sorting domain-containing protein [uncultured Lacinutrix sp.]|uniref:T9SS type A sorting domain-containing protein n=1 Tax=uncultured Lacinutrix sp. TaxID=574032 RepID=UPI0026092441|nr:T9SS type A sorting domain-containing protein [uncultured Lacinutrix sp.]